MTHGIVVVHRQCLLTELHFWADMRLDCFSSSHFGHSWAVGPVGLSQLARSLPRHFGVGRQFLHFLSTWTYAAAQKII